MSMVKQPPKGANADRLHQLHVCEKICPDIHEMILTGIGKASQKLIIIIITKIQLLKLPSLA